MTKTIMFTGGRKIVDGVEVSGPKFPLTETGRPSSMLRVAAAMRSHRQLVGPHQVAVMTARVEAARRRPGTPSDRSHETPGFQASLDLVEKSRLVYGRIMADCVPAGMRASDLLEQAARHSMQVRASLGYRTAAEQVDAADLAAQVREALIDISREWTFALLRAYRDDANQAARPWLNSMVKFCAGLWRAALDS